MNNKNITHKKCIFEQKELKFIFKCLKESKLLPCEDIHIYYWPKTDVFVEGNYERLDYAKTKD